jgi:hypothetical protein
MTVAGTIAYKFLAHATYLHVYTLTGIPVPATQVDSTTFDLFARNLREGTRGATNCVENYCVVNWLANGHCASNLHMPLTSMQVTVPFYRHVHRLYSICGYKN